MHANMSSIARATTGAGADEIVVDDLYPFLRKYEDGRIERLVTSSFVPASEVPGATGVATRDVIIDPSTGVSARLFLSARAVATGKRLPIIVYFHGGGFCTGSAFAKLFHRYAASLSARAGALVVSVDYRLAPEHPIPAAFDDAWAALRWAVSSLRVDPWLAYHADRTRVFLAGESAGANIAHNVASRAGTTDGDIDIEGMILLQPFFWGSDRLPLETVDQQKDGRHNKMLFVPEKLDKFWPFLTAGTAGSDDPRLNPTAEAVASLPCRRALVAVASEDLARHRGRRYAAWLRDGGRRWCRDVTLVESEGEDHAFHLYRPSRATAVELMDRVVTFVHESTPPAAAAAAPPLNTDVVETGRAVLHARPVVVNNDTLCCRVTLGHGAGNKTMRVTPRSVAREPLVLGSWKASVLPRFGLMKTVRVIL